MGALEALSLALAVLKIVRDLSDEQASRSITASLEAAGEAVTRAQRDGRDLTDDELEAFRAVRQSALEALHRQIGSSPA